jgi:NAD(P)-dependent dehydrogenase (short-subunit alcohol dehydrogenase family)
MRRARLSAPPVVPVAGPPGRGPRCRRGSVSEGGAAGSSVPVLEPGPGNEPQGVDGPRRVARGSPCRRARLIDPEEIAHLVAFLASPLSAATNGAALRAEGTLLLSIC